MITRTLIKKGAYYDSVTLMQAAKKLSALDGIKDSAVVMATRENKNIIKASGLLTADIEKAGDNDLAVAVLAASEAQAAAALKAVEDILKKKPSATSGSAGVSAASLDGALQILEGANMALISVAGRFAGKLAMDCLEKGLHVMIFSDNVTIEEEAALKKMAVKKGLFVMGPDCGTAIINGAPLAFANAVSRGDIGIVAASGTGLQEVSTLISNEGGGISQAIGTGSRDVKKEIGALTLVQGLKALAADKDTGLIVIVSKPPHPEVMKKVMAEVKKIKKPVVAVLLGGETVLPGKKDLYGARTLEEAALKAVHIARCGSVHKAKERIFDINTEIEKAAVIEARKKTSAQKYLRGLFSGGTFASEAQIVLAPVIGPLWSNVPLEKKYKLADSLELKGNSVIDLGEDEFTVGRPHPMIDYSLRNKAIITQSLDPQTAVILLDVVLGYGSNEHPLEDILPPIAAAFKNNKALTITASVTGTDSDPQIRARVVKGLRAAGVIVMPSNAAACRMAGEIIRRVR